jgi:hypothetical protein
MGIVSFSFFFLETQHNTAKCAKTNISPKEKQ